MELFSYVSRITHPVSGLVQKTRRGFVELRYRRDCEVISKQGLRTEALKTVAVRKDRFDVLVAVLA